MRFLWVFALWPLVEIALFVVVGGRIGLGATLGVIVATGALGVWILRRIGRAKGSASAYDAADQILRVLAAILLILPGFMTDALGLVLLIPLLRRALIALGAARIAMRFGPLRQAAGGANRTADYQVIDAEYVDVSPPDAGGRSPWTDR